MKKIKDKKNLKLLIVQFIKFGMVGALNTVLSYGITNAGYYVFHLHEQLCNIIAFVITVFISFMLNNKYVFKKEDNKDEKSKKKTFWKSLAKVYVSYSITGLFLTALLLYLEESIFGIPHYIATLANLIITIPLNFVLNKFWAFK